jgi:hypothetical protein
VSLLTSMPAPCSHDATVLCTQTSMEVARPQKLSAAMGNGEPKFSRAQASARHRTRPHDCSHVVTAPAVAASGYR